MLYLNFNKDAEFDFHSGGEFVSRNNYTHPARIMKNAVLLVGTDGECPINHNGNRYILKKGEFLLLFPDIEHGGSAPTSDVQSHFWCHFFLPENCKITDNPSTDWDFVIPEHGYLNDEKSIFILFRQLANSHKNQYNKKAFRNVLCNSYLKILLSTLANEFLLNCEKKDMSNQKIVILKTEEWIRLNCTKDITVRDVANEFGYNSDYLTQIFKKQTKKTIIEYINLMRIKEAKSLLLNSDMKIADIAIKCGFSNEKYFMRQFKKSENVTPSQYRLFQGTFRTKKGM